MRNINIKKVINDFYKGHRFWDLRLSFVMMKINNFRYTMEEELNEYNK